MSTTAVASKCAAGAAHSLVADKLDLKTPRSIPPFAAHPYPFDYNLQLARRPLGGNVAEKLNLPCITTLECGALSPLYPSQARRDSKKLDNHEVLDNDYQSGDKRRTPKSPEGR